MSAVQVSRAVRLAVEARFGLLFNDALVNACIEFGVPVAWMPPINFAEDAAGLKNFYRGDWSLEGLSTYCEPDWPAVAMWTGEGQDQSNEKPRKFSGVLAVYWRFFLVVPGLRRAGLTDMREAVEAAMIATLEPEGIQYRGDLSWTPLTEQTILGQDEKHFGWLQQVTYNASFEVNV